MASSRNDAHFPGFGSGVATNISVALPQPNGTAAAGTTGEVSDAGHIHRLSYLSELNAWGVPTGYNANTNSPALTSGTANTTNTSFVVTTAGSTTPDSLGAVVVGDILYFDAAAGVWRKLDVSIYERVAWASLGTGAYTDQIKMVISGVGNQPFLMRWDGSAWFPMGGRQLYYVGAKLTDSTATTQSITLPTVAHPASFFRTGLGLEIEIIAEDSVTATARSLLIQLGAGNIVNLTTAANRRVGGLFGFITESATSQVCTTKSDVAVVMPYDSGNSNLTTMSETVANALNITGTVTFTAAGTATLRRYKLWYVTG